MSDSPKVDICDILDDMELYAYENDAPAAGRNIGQARVYLLKMIEVVSALKLAVKNYKPDSWWTITNNGNALDKLIRLTELLSPDDADAVSEDDE